MTFHPEQLYIKNGVQAQAEDAAAAGSSSGAAGSSRSDHDLQAGTSSDSSSASAGESADTSSSSGSSTEGQSSADAAATDASGQAAADDVNGDADTYVSTDGQDTQSCPLLKLPGQLHLQAKSTSWVRRSGAMENPNDVSMTSWTQNFLAQRWKTIYFRDVDGKMALKAVPTDKDILSRSYDWAPKNTSTEYALFTDYNRDLRQEAGWVAETDTSKTWVALCDCAGDLLFVFCLQAGEPGHTDIYDRSGNYLAHTLNDPVVARYQFIDVNGHLLATAESPGLWQNIPRKDVPSGDNYGGILYYELGYEEGGYADSSRLMDQDYRWVIASAMQVNAVYEAEEDWMPNAQAPRPAHAT